MLSIGIASTGVLTLAYFAIASHLLKGRAAPQYSHLDVLWSVASYERLVNEWQLDRDDAIRVITWAIGLVEAAVGDDRRPSRSKGAR